jgi:hypothetical protein
MRTDKVLALLDEKDKAHAQERAEREQAHNEERQAWAVERRSLLDRIQQPEIRQVVADPQYIDPPQPFEDGEEMARVGGVFYDPPPSNQDQAEIDKVGTIIGMEA